MTLEQYKFDAELARVRAAKAEMLYIRAQRMEEIRRLEDNIKKQEEAEALLIEKLGEK